MKRVLWIIATFASLLLVLLAQQPDIRERISGGTTTRIAIPDLRGSGAAQPLMNAFNETLYNDLDASGLFKIVPKTMYPLQVPQQPSDFREQPAPQPTRPGQQPPNGGGAWLSDWSSPPVSANSEVSDPNWPKDPDEARRQADRKARQKVKPSPMEAARPLTPAELNVGRTAAPARTNNDPVQPGNSFNNPILSPSQLGFEGRFSDLFGGSKSESKTFTSEPPRESLTEPPPGYQTPSPNYAYGTGPKAPLASQHYDIMSGKDTGN